MTGATDGTSMLLHLQEKEQITLGFSGSVRAKTINKDNNNGTEEETEESRLKPGLSLGSGIKGQN